MVVGFLVVIGVFLEDFLYEGGGIRECLLGIVVINLVGEDYVIWCGGCIVSDGVING